MSQYVRIVATLSPTDITCRDFLMHGQAVFIDSVDPGATIYCYMGFAVKLGESEEIFLIDSNLFGVASDQTINWWQPMYGQPPAIRIRYCCYARILGGGNVYGSWVDFNLLPIDVSTNLVTEITMTSAKFNSSIDIHFTNSTNGYWGFEYKKGLLGTVEEVKSSLESLVTMDYFMNIPGLDSSSVYYVRAFAYFYVEPYTRFYGSWRLFVTQTAPLVITNPATLIGNHVATLNGQVISGADEIIETGFYWGLFDSIKYMNKEVVGETSGVIYKALTDLVFGTTYFFAAYAIGESEDVYYGEILEFSTTAEVPSITTQIATDIEALSVTGNGTLLSVGGREEYCSERGFDVEYEFSGTLKEYAVWLSYEFTGNVILNLGTGLWEGTLIKVYEEIDEFMPEIYEMSLDGLICAKPYLYRAKAENSVGWGFGEYLAFTTDELLMRKACTIGVWTILLCAYVNPIPLGSIIKRRGFRWGIYNTAEEYDIHEDGNFLASAIIGPVDTISFFCSSDDNTYDTIIDSSKGFISAGFTAGKFINVSATGSLSIENEGQFKIMSVSGDGGTIEVNVRNTLVSEAVIGVTIVELFALYIVDLTPETIYYSVAYVAIEDSEGDWSVQEGGVASAETLPNPFEIEGYDKVEFYKVEGEQNYKKITRKIFAEIIAEQQYIEMVGGRRILDIENHLIQTNEDAIAIGTSYKDRFKIIKSIMEIEYPTPAPFQREDTLDFGFGRIRFKEDGMGVVNFMPDGEGLMVFRYRMIMMIRKINLAESFAEDSVSYIANMELEEA